MTDDIYNSSETEILQYFIGEEMRKNQFKPKTDIPGVARKKTVITCVFSLLNLVFISSYFFHFLKNLYLLEIVNVIVYWIFMRRYNTMQYLIKEVKSRPDEEIGYIVANLLSGAHKQVRLPKIRLAMIAVSVVLPLVLFLTPHTFYEEAEDGYYVRFYTRGILQSSEIRIPKRHNGERVVGIRGNVFANLSGVEEIYLPDSITTIRGYAFAHSKDLFYVEMPESLTYLGGSAFEGCTQLYSIFLPEGLTEIRGATFKNCTSLESIEIPEGVERIGGDAFRGCEYLEEVTFPSTLEEIGSSAFRDCDFLFEVWIPSDTDVNIKAFKDCPAEIYTFD